ncbi:uncharacterized protein LOC114158049 [Xiphophorus couchianus]|uniref:uncharacterized protein LOC114158049 n=1 Tax=Xiphophorus couchianus TaxID=32473 RepID=UPI001016C776|nr:uncharacterized protein LOC114158049 [Xiphophorus couchianus]
MQQVVWISLVLLNVVWISFFLTPDLDFSVFVQRRSVSSSDETFMTKFCLQPDSDRKWTSAGPSASGPDEDVNTVTEPTVNRKKSQHEESNPDDKFPTSAAPDPDGNNLGEPTVSAHEQRLTSPPGLSSSSDLVATIPTTPRNQRMDVGRTGQQEPLTTIRQTSLAFPEECCFVLMKRPVNEKLIASVDLTDPCCPINAAILITKKAQHLCVDPTEPWVKRIIDFLQTRDLNGPTLSTPYKSLTLSEVSSSPMPRQEIPTTPRHQKINITLSPPRTEPERGAGPVECCFQICKTPIDGREIASFHVTDPLCPTSAAVLITKTAEHLCADPKEQWVKMIINFLEKKAP